MNDFKLIVRLMAAIEAGEEAPVFSCALIDEKTLKTTSNQRDRMALKLQKAGYIDGLYIVDDLDNMQIPVIMWEYSNPTVTLSGLQYMQENSAFKKAAQELKDAGISLASQTIANIISTRFGT